MGEEALQQRAPSARRITSGRLDGHRLAFTRKSIRSDSGVADAIPAAGFSIGGFLFEIDADDLPGLERKEGMLLTPPAYKRSMVQVWRHDTRETVEAMTFVVADPGPVEFAPSNAYLADMIAQVDSVPLLTQYHAFLVWLADLCGHGQPGAPLVRPGLLVNTTASIDDRGIPQVRVKAHSAPPKTSTYVRVSFGHRSTIGRQVRDAQLHEGNCGLDQSLRQALGIAGQKVYGHTVTVEALRDGPRPRDTIGARSLVLGLHQARVADCEKRLCVLHPRNMTLLGCAEGDFVTLFRTSNAPESPRCWKVTLRAYSASPGTDGSYPAIDELYVDQECRSELGIAPGTTGYLGQPVLVRPSVVGMMRKSAVPYGLTVLLGITAFTELLHDFFPYLGSPWVAATALVVACVLTIVVARLDVVTKVHR